MNRKNERKGLFGQQLHQEDLSSAHAADDDRVRPHHDPLRLETTVAEEYVENVDMETVMVEYIDWHRS